MVPGRAVAVAEAKRLRVGWEWGKPLEPKRARWGVCSCCTRLETAQAVNRPPVYVLVALLQIYNWQGPRSAR